MAERQGETDDLTIQTTHGKVRGEQRSTVYDDPYFSFDGIPYGKSPIGDLRFRPPQPVEPWSGVRDCSEMDVPKSIQFNRYTGQVEGSEDCLYLNVYAKRLSSEKPLPVMVYIHGGGFTIGGASRLCWGPDYLLMKDVVYISIGYRLGCLGFLSLKDPSVGVPGNMGVKDVILALKWIQKNCLAFNGDPGNITLFGHSSGASIVHMLLLSDQAKDLFHKAILMAGFTYNMESVPNLPYRMAKQIGYGGENDDQSIYDFLSSVDANKLAMFTAWTEEEKDRGYQSYAFKNCIEPYETSEAVITQNPVELQKTTWSNRIPIILGCNSLEGLIQRKFYTLDPELYVKYEQHPEYLLPNELWNKCEGDKRKALARRLIELHFDGRELRVENSDAAIELESFKFSHPCQRTVQARLAYSLAPTYLYRFDFDSPTFNLHRIKHCGPDVRGVAHVDELSYMFWMPNSFRLPPDSPEFLTIRRMVDMWTNFARNSDPNSTLIRPAVWKPVERFGPRQCLNVSYDVRLMEYPESEKNQVWDEIYREAGIQLI